MLIESFQNPKIRSLIKLHEKSRERKKSGYFVVEGVQENELALRANYKLKEVYICEEIYCSSLNFNSVNITYITKALFEKLAYRKSTGGILSIYEYRSTNLDQLKLSENPLIVVLESIEKPGNLGAILRTADGAKVDAVIICDETTDFYNPNVIRSSVGTLFTNQIACANQLEVLDWLKKNHINIYSTFLRDETICLYHIDLRKPVAIILGTEATGLSDFWIDHSTNLIKIPMHGFVDSLNVSNAAAICIYETLRQRINF